MLEPRLGSGAVEGGRVHMAKVAGARLPPRSTSVRQTMSLRIITGQGQVGLLFFLCHLRAGPRTEAAIPTQASHKCYRNCHVGRALAGRSPSPSPRWRLIEGPRLAAAQSSHRVRRMRGAARTGTFMIDAVLFDIDGTLAHRREGHVTAWVAVPGAMGRRCNRQADQPPAETEFHDAEATV